MAQIAAIRHDVESARAAAAGAQAVLCDGAEAMKPQLSHHLPKELPTPDHLPRVLLSEYLAMREGQMLAAHTKGEQFVVVDDKTEQIIAIVGLNGIRTLACESSDADGDAADTVAERHDAPNAGAGAWTD